MEFCLGPKWALRRCVLGVWVALVGGAFAPTSGGEVVAIHGGSIVPAPGKRIDGGTVILRDGLINAVGRSVPIPFDAEVFDATGLTIYAGFIDASAKVGLPEVKHVAGPTEGAPVDFRTTSLAVTQEANRKNTFPDLHVANYFKLDLKGCEPHHQAGFTAALVSPHTGVLSGQGALVCLSGGPRRATVIASPVAVHASFRGSGTGYPSSLMAVTAHLRQVFLDSQRYRRLVARYHEQTAGVPRPPYDPALAALVPVLDGVTPLFFRVRSALAIDRALRLADEFDLRVVINGVHDAWKVADRLAERNTGVLLRLDLPEEPGSARRQLEVAQDEAKNGPKHPPWEDLPPKDRFREPRRVTEEARRQWLEAVRCAEVLESHGVAYAFVTQGEAPEKSLGHLAQRIREGLPAEAALRALTVTPARLLGVEKQLGTISPGKIANLTVLNAPLGDEKNSVAYVFVDGKDFEVAGRKSPQDETDRGGATEGAKKRPIDKAVESDRGPATLREPSTPAATEIPTELAGDRVPATRTRGSCLIRNATILTASHGRVEGGDVRVDAGKIAEIGRRLKAPPGVAVIDAKGRYLIPGIIDCHSHMAIAGGVNEGTLSITAECRIQDTLRNDDPTIYRALAGGVTAANLLHGSANPIGGQNAVIKLKYLRPVEELFFPGAPRGIKFALGENPKRSRSARRSTRFPGSRMGVEAVIRRGFIEAREYIKTWEEYAAARLRGQSILDPRRDLRLETLAGVLRGEVLVHSHCYRADEILMLIRLAEEFGFRVATFQHVLEGYKVAPEIAQHGAGASTFSDWWAYKVEAYDAIPYNAALMTRAGVSVSLNSDSGELVRRLYHEAAKAMKYGDLSEEDALRLVTLNPAEQLGIDARAGSIDVGKDADLALFDGHPFSVYSRCDMTLIDGEVYFERVPRRIEVPSYGTDSAPTLVAAESGDGSARVRDGGGATAFTVGTREDSPDRATYAVVNARLHRVSGPVIPRGTLIVRGNRIAALGADVDVPSNALIVDGNGLHVYPGMVDSGTTIGLTEIGSISATQDSRENGDFNPDLRCWVALNHDSEIIPVTRVNGITSVFTGPSGGLLAGQAALIHLDGWTREEMLLKTPAALIIEFPQVPIEKKWQEDDRVKELQGYLQRARRYADDLKEAAQLEVRPPRRNPKLEGMIPFIRGEGAVVLTANRMKHIVDAVEFALSEGLRPILRGGREAWKVAGYLRAKNIPCIVGPVHATPLNAYDPYDSVFFNAGVLERAGVRFAFQTGSSSNSRNLPYHAGMAVAFGLSRDAAIRALTLSAAEIWGLEDRIGSLEVGKIADFFVCDGDPLEFRTRILHLFINGRPVSLESKHTRLYERYLGRSGRPKMTPAGSSMRF